MTDSVKPCVRLAVCMAQCAPEPAKAPSRFSAPQQHSEADPFAAADMANAASRPDEEPRGRRRGARLRLRVLARRIPQGLDGRVVAFVLAELVESLAKHEPQLTPT